MLNDFLPGIVSIGILAAAFLFVWTSDVRRLNRSNVAEAEDAEIPLLEMKTDEPSRS